MSAGTPMQAATTVGMIIAVLVAVACGLYLAWHAFQESRGH
ncbi:hypothetical protein [Actinokineospora sp. HUAS TT18]